MTQGTLLDKIYEERGLGEILKIMMLRRYENSCIRFQYRKGRPNRNNPETGTFNKNQGNVNPQQHSKNFNTPQNNQINQNQNYRNFNQHNQITNNQQNPRNQDGNQNNRNLQQNYRYNNSGQFRQNNAQQNIRSNNSGQSRQHQNYQQSGSHQTRQHRPGNVEPMEIDNLESDQNRTTDDYNETNDSNHQCDQQAEVNNTVFFMKQPRNTYH